MCFFWKLILATDGELESITVGEMESTAGYALPKVCCVVPKKCVCEPGFLDGDLFHATHS